MRWTLHVCCTTDCQASLSLNMVNVGCLTLKDSGAELHEYAGADSSSHRAFETAPGSFAQVAQPYVTNMEVFENCARQPCVLAFKVRGVGLRMNRQLVCVVCATSVRVQLTVVDTVGRLTCPNVESISGMQLCCTGSPAMLSDPKCGVSALP